jgi:UDP-N-acetylmuramoyl-tripeptide--D-alanyl-D-alanine ligase
MGLTITIREQLKALHQVFIAEMGADKKGEIEHLSRFIQPKYGILTSIGPQHLNTFKTQENITNEKFRLIENLPQDGLAVLNYDYALVRDYPIKNKVKVVSYAIDQAADFTASNIVYTPSGSSFDVLIEGQVVSFQTRLLGKHNISNILAGIALGHHLGLDIASLQKAVKAVNYVEHRLQLKKINGLNYIDNAYNSNPVGSMMALDVLSMMPHRRFIVTPGMIELGEQEDQHNTNFGSYMKGRADVVILVGPVQTKPIYKGLEESGFDMEHVYVVSRVKEAFALVESLANEQDIILLENDLPDAFNR